MENIRAAQKKQKTEYRNSKGKRQKEYTYGDEVLKKNSRKAGQKGKMFSLILKKQNPNMIGCALNNGFEIKRDRQMNFSFLPSFKKSQLVASFHALFHTVREIEAFVEKFYLENLSVDC